METRKRVLDGLDVLVARGSGAGAAGRVPRPAAHAVRYQRLIEAAEARWRKARCAVSNALL